MRTLLILAALLAANVVHAVAPTLEDRATEIALTVKCGDADECRVLRYDDARKVATDILDSCSAHVPRRECLILVATLSESKMNAHPTCSSSKCRKRCGTAPAGKQRRCRVLCAVSKGERAVRRALNCNDGGTSKGWFQLKRMLIRRCPKVDGRRVNPHDVREAATCYAWHVSRSHLKNACKIKDVGKRWSVSFARLAAGHSAKATLKHKDGTETEIKVRRCHPHSYARRAKRQLEAAPDTFDYPRAVNVKKPTRVASP